MSFITAKNIIKEFIVEKNTIRALGPVSLEIQRGSFTVILGRSGSGKSTFLNLMAGLDTPTSGSLIVDDKDLSHYNSKQLAKYRSGVGVIFQSYNLLPNLNTLENILMGSWAGGKKGDKDQAMNLLKLVGLEHRANANVKTLSGGEKQRVAICRALMDDPKILFCDEPTGALDTANENQVKDLLIKLNKEQGITIVMVTHNPEFAGIAGRIVTMKDGKIDKIERG